MIKRYLRNLIIPAFMAAASLTAAASPAPGISVETQAPVASVKCGQGYLEISVAGDNVERFHIFSITGQLVKTVDVAAGSVTVDIPRGCYIVKCSQWSKQVIVK